MDRQCVGIDFHRRRSVMVRLAADGERLGVHRIVNDSFEFVKVVGLCGESLGLSASPFLMSRPCVRLKLPT